MPVVICYLFWVVNRTSDTTDYLYAHEILHVKVVTAFWQARSCHTIAVHLLSTSCGTAYKAPSRQDA